MMPREKEKFNNEILAEIQKELGLANPMQVPRLTKIVMNSGLGEGAKDAKLLDAAVQDMATITGQMPVITRAKKSVAGFKLREDMPIGVRVTLRGDMMWEFFDRLVSTALPRIRDFRGLRSTSFDGRGNYSLGITEQLVFPEIDYDNLYKTIGFDITIVTTAENDDACYTLLKKLGMPLKERKTALVAV